MTVRKEATRSITVSKDKARIVVPMHARKTIKFKTLVGILEDMSLSSEEFRKLL